ncbi:hypothetical protein [Brachybacterium tyrofermentans]|uniref:hypothetical protein n=1 Tax=Brachybacterium tyrofermentans TaxID=47848 RepID=UPI003FD589F6
MSTSTTTTTRAAERRSAGILRTRRCVLLLLSVSTLVAGCGLLEAVNPPPTVTLTVISSDWTGWSTDQPAPESATESVTKGSEFTRDGAGGELTFTVTSVDDEELTLRTSQPMSERSETGGIDLTTNQKSFTVAVGDTLEITTPTMDGGTTYAITYEE